MSERESVICSEVETPVCEQLDRVMNKQNTSFPLSIKTRKVQNLEKISFQQVLKFFGGSTNFYFYFAFSGFCANHLLTVTGFQQKTEKLTETKAIESPRLEKPKKFRATKLSS